MPEKATIERAKRDRRQGKSASTAAGEFVRDEIRRIRKGAHGAKSAKQAIAIGLSEARRAGFDPGGDPGSAKRPKRKATTKRKSAPRRSTAATKRTSAARSRAATKALKRQPRRAASHLALSRQAHRVARSRTKADRSAAARKAARTRARAR
jgi:hypothetical protein